MVLLPDDRRIAGGAAGRADPRRPRRPTTRSPARAPAARAADRTPAPHRPGHDRRPRHRWPTTLPKRTPTPGRPVGAVAGARRRPAAPVVARARGRAGDPRLGARLRRPVDERRRPQAGAGPGQRRRGRARSSRPTTSRSCGCRPTPASTLVASSASDQVDRPAGHHQPAGRLAARPRGGRRRRRPGARARPSIAIPVPRTGIPSDDLETGDRLRSTAPRERRRRGRARSRGHRRGPGVLGRTRATSSELRRPDLGDRRREPRPRDRQRRGAGPDLRRPRRAAG